MPPWRESWRRAGYERIIRDSLPGREVRKIQLNTQGYLNVVFEVDDRWIFRFPRSLRAARLLQMEIRLLPELAPRLRVAVPQPFVLGSLPGRRRWPFMGYEKIPGEGRSWAALSPRERSVLQRELRPVFRDLAAFPWRRALRLGVPGGDGEAERREMRRFHASLGRWAYPRLPEALRGEVERRFRDHLEDPANFRFRPCLLHVEVHSSHVLWHRGHVRGLIDWGFAAVGDPAREFIPWTAHFGTTAVPRLAEGRVGPRDATFFSRLELYRLFVPLWRVRNASFAGDAAGVRQGVSWLRRALRTPPTEGWST